MFTESLPLLLDPLAIFLLVLGVLVGVVVGAIPGLSATLAVALLIPFTFNLELMPALSMLLGVFFGAVYGGSIPAILFRTPGTPASAATVLDGYALARKGGSRQALTIAAFYALLGGVIGTLILMFLSPYIASVALRFGSPEYFALAFFGLSMIVAVSGASLLKSLSVALFGLLLATVGMDPISGYPRFLFGSVSLMEGIPFIPALIGLFAIAEVFRGMRDTSQIEKMKGGGTSWFPPGKDIRHTLWTGIRSGILGTGVGATPGAGSDIAAYMAYGMAKQRAKEGEMFGEGEIKGIAAPEAAKTGSVSGALVPLLSLGIPGDSVTAVLIGAFVLHGVQPGPLMFTEHGALTGAILWLVLLAHALVFLVAVLCTRFLVRLASMDRRFLLSGILVLSLIGAFALRNNIMDVWIAIGFGVLGYVLEKNDYPVAPLLLALILGPMAEENFRRSMILSGGDATTLLSHPIAAAILTLALLSLFGPLMKKGFRWVLAR
jgi:putative tricarboxylic transport membrane protein